ncbi:putative recombination exonuclease [Bacillus phage Bp8p-C]|uniref:Putative recombination exonuclease n=2 Tax=Agatevirus Bp8pC TaxID=1910937 RepID=A0A0A0PLC6_9CAUD|nr:recombination exonuclease [Bacillus phage Bp8p-C]YP_009784395.1 putative recombination exonuclease [Bacillus phage Bp8p-T]AHJ87525.1 putative recombination exonuclease [Bacillus phage Bp8p-C]AHJ87736.1 putative recombination exonuclease [Bacillus phage Bp8p-T]
MTKIVHFTDFHAHIFEDFSKPDKRYITDRFKAQIDTLHTVFEIAREHNAVLLFGGDLFHKRKTLEDIVFNEVFEVFAQYSDVSVYMVRGNHDSRDNSTTSRHWLEPFRCLPNVTVFSTPGYVEVEQDGFIFNLFAIPYSDDTDRLKQAINGFADIAGKAANPSILAGHIGVDGSEIGRYSHRLAGAFSVSDLRPDVFNYVALGHYHKRQFLGGTDNVFYTGNTIQASFSDEGQEKGVMLIDLEAGGKPTFIPIENKQFITLTQVDENTQQLVDNHYVRLILPKEQVKEVEVFKEKSDNFRLEVTRSYKTETRIGIEMDSTEEQIVSEYTKEFYPGTTEIALDILREARDSL